jgi:bifunctional UDP-N-acetylglucosamine pyrophosphorylase/glucosamine-1-phosphate N-acetyltransferase
VATTKEPILQEKISTIVLAAGVGKRMKSKTPKVLHRILGKPVISFVLDLACDLGSAETILVVSDRADDFYRTLDESVRYALQEIPLGTGDAAKKGLDKAAHDNVLILCGDVPLLKKDTVVGLIEHHKHVNADVTVLTCETDDPFGYGRILRDKNGRVVNIIEQIDATPEQQTIKEINAGVYFGKTTVISSALTALTRDNRQGEYYLTDIIRTLVNAGRTAAGYLIRNIEETIGVNTKDQLTRVRAIVKDRWFSELMKQGVYIEDPVTTNIDLSVRIGEHVRIRPFSLIEGDTTISPGETIGPFVWIRDGKVMGLTHA